MFLSGKATYTYSIKLAMIVVIKLMRILGITGYKSGLYPAPQKGLAGVPGIEKLYTIIFYVIHPSSLRINF